MIPGKEVKNFFLLIFFKVGPKITLPCGVVLFFNKTILFIENFTTEPSVLKSSFLDLTSIPFVFVFFFNQLSGLVFFTLTLTKSPTRETFLENPTYRCIIDTHQTPHLSAGTK